MPSNIVLLHILNDIRSYYRLLSQDESFVVSFHSTILSQLDADNV